MKALITGKGVKIALYWWLLLLLSFCVFSFLSSFFANNIGHWVGLGWCRYLSVLKLAGASIIGLIKVRKFDPVAQTLTRPTAMAIGLGITVPYGAAP